MAFLSELEFSILYWLQGIHNPILDPFMTSISFLGNKGGIFILIGAALFCIKKTRKIGLAVLLSLLGGLLIGNGLLKHLVMRQRPCWIDDSIQLLIHNPTDYSFPSGHTLASFETAVSVFLYSKRWGIVLFVFAAVMALSRLYLFVHFPTDVLSGMALGIFIGWYVHRILEKYGNSAILRHIK